MKILAKCYRKNCTALIARICIDEPLFKLFTDTVQPQQHHIPKHGLRDDEARKILFF